MDHMFIMRLAALLFGGGIASCLFPGKSRMSHVLFLLLVLAETAVAHATTPDGWWFLLPGVVSVLLRLSFKGGTESGKGGKALLSLHATDGTIIRYYYWFSNFLVYGGAGSGKTKSIGKPLMERKYSINSLVYWVTYVHNVVYSFYRSMIYCYINSTQRCAGSIVIDIIPTNGADKRKFFPFAPYFPVTNVIKRYFYPYFPAIIGIKGYSFPYFPYLSGIMKIKTALYSLFSRLDWHKTVVFPCLGEIYEGIRSLSWEIPVT